jgi:hypothetical protein
VQGRYAGYLTSRKRVGRTIKVRSINGEIEMTASLNQGSAKIYQFPAGGRAALGGRRYEETRTVTELASSRVSDVAIGGAWYHDAAIQDTREH